MPWSRSVFLYRQQTKFKDDPVNRCLPPGGPRQFQQPQGVQFVEQREVGRILVLLGGGNRNWRIIHTDGRPIGESAEAGDLVIPIREGAVDASHIAGEIGDVFGGRMAGRGDASEITIFKSLGMAVEDVAAARLAFDRASERGLGRGFVL